MLNKNEVKVIRALVEQAWSESEGEFGFTDNIKVKGLNKHQIAGYIGDLEKKGYIRIYHEVGYDLFLLMKKVEEIFPDVEVYEDNHFILRKWTTQ